MIAALLLALQPAPAAVAEPDRAMLDAFQAACARIGNVEQALADARDSGWEPADREDTRIAGLISLGRNVRYLVPPVFFRREIAGRELFLAISDSEGMGAFRSKDCRLFHFEALAPIDAGLIERWAGRPLPAQDSPELGFRSIWEPEWRDGISLAITFVSASSPMRGRQGLSGNVLVAQVNSGL